jgi:hypothetical protein
MYHPKPLSPERRHLRAIKAKLVQAGGDTTDVDIAIKVERLTDVITREAAADPPLSIEQRVRLAALLLDPRAGDR